MHLQFNTKLLEKTIHLTKSTLEDMGQTMVDYRHHNVDRQEFIH